MLEKYYIGETVREGQSYAVLDAAALFQNRRECELKKAVRIEPVYTWFPKAGDQIAKSTGDTFTANGTETVFIKKLDPEGTKLKVYIPSGTKGPLTEEELSEKYTPCVKVSPQDRTADAVSDYVNQHSLSGKAEFYIRIPRPDKAIAILHEAIDRPAIILNARGKGEDQTLMPGDSLKFEDNECLPLPKAELETAWKVIENKYPPVGKGWLKQ